MRKTIVTLIFGFLCSFINAQDLYTETPNQYMQIRVKITSAYNLPEIFFVSDIFYCQYRDKATLDSWTQQFINFISNQPEYKNIAKDYYPLTRPAVDGVWNNDTRSGLESKSVKPNNYLKVIKLNFKINNCRLKNDTNSNTKSIEENSKTKNNTNKKASNTSQKKQKINNENIEGLKTNYYDNGNIKSKEISHNEIKYLSYFNQNGLRSKSYQLLSKNNKVFYYQYSNEGKRRISLSIRKEGFLVSVMDKKNDIKSLQLYVIRKENFSTITNLNCFVDRSYKTKNNETYFSRNEIGKIISFYPLSQEIQNNMTKDLPKINAGIIKELEYNNNDGSKDYYLFNDKGIPLIWKVYRYNSLQKSFNYDINIKNWVEEKPSISKQNEDNGEKEYFKITHLTAFSNQTWAFEYDEVDRSENYKYWNRNEKYIIYFYGTQSELNNFLPRSINYVNNIYKNYNFNGIYKESKSGEKVANYNVLKRAFDDGKTAVHLKMEVEKTGKDILEKANSNLNFYKNSSNRRTRSYLINQYIISDAEDIDYTFLFNKYTK